MRQPDTKSRTPKKREHSGGKPNKYLPEYCDRLIAHMAQGLSFQSFAWEIRVGRSTLYDWVSNHSEFAQAKEIAEIASLSWWEKQGLQGIWSKDFKAAAYIFIMKCRFAKMGYREVPEDEVKNLQDKVELGNKLLAQLTNIGQDPRCQPSNSLMQPSQSLAPCSPQGLITVSSKEESIP